MIKLYGNVILGIKALSNGHAIIISKYVYRMLNILVSTKIDLYRFFNNLQKMKIKQRNNVSSNNRIKLDSVFGT